jgi:hypothetical protein
MCNVQVLNISMESYEYTYNTHTHRRFLIYKKAYKREVESSIPEELREYSKGSGHSEQNCVVVLLL